MKLLFLLLLFPLMSFNRIDYSIEVVIQPRSSWNAQTARPYKKHTPVRITIHHEGGKILLKNGDGDYCGHTNCPGQNIYTYFENGEIKKQVKTLLSNQK